MVNVPTEIETRIWAVRSEEGRERERENEPTSRIRESQWLNRSKCTSDELQHEMMLNDRITKAALNSPFAYQQINKIVHTIRTHISLYNIVRCMRVLVHAILQPTARCGKCGLFISHPKSIGWIVKPRAREQRKQEKLINWQNQQNSDEKKSIYSGRWPKVKQIENTGKKGREREKSET